MTNRWKRLAPLSGIVFVGLVVAALIIEGDSPDAHTGPARIVDYYSSHHGRVNAHIVLMGYAALFACVYFTSMAHYLRSYGAQILATLTIVGGALLATSFGLIAGSAAMLGDATNHVSPTVLQTLNAVSSDIFWPVMLVGATLATLAMGIAMLRTRALPKALAIATIVVGAASLTGVLGWFAFMALGPLTIVIACYTYARLGQPLSVTLPEMPDQRAATESMGSTKRGRTKIS